MSLREVFGIGAIAAGFGLYAVLGSDLGERLIWVASGGRDPGSGGPQGIDKHAEPGPASDAGGR